MKWGLGGLTYQNVAHYILALSCAARGGARCGERIGTLYVDSNLLKLFTRLFKIYLCVWKYITWIKVLWAKIHTQAPTSSTDYCKDLKLYTLNYFKSWLTIYQFIYSVISFLNIYFYLDNWSSLYYFLDHE